MRVYHERLRVPLSWWIVGLATIVILATEVVPGWPVLVQVAVYVVLVGGFAAMLLNWGRPSVDVGAGELRVGAARLPLAAVGEVTALDEAQTRSLRGPRGDPAAFLFIRPYLRQSVYVEVTTQAAAIPATATSGTGDSIRDGESRRWGRRPRQRASTMAAGTAAPYWLVCTRHPAELAAAINGARPAARADGAAVG
jgi:Protein of unknown function (DUF3093)